MWTCVVMQNERSISEQVRSIFVHCSAHLRQKVTVKSCCYACSTRHNGFLAGKVSPTVSLRVSSPRVLPRVFPRLLVRLLARLLARLFVPKSLAKSLGSDYMHDSRRDSRRDSFFGKNHHLLKFRLCLSEFFGPW